MTLTKGSDACAQVEAGNLRVEHLGRKPGEASEIRSTRFVHRMAKGDGRLPAMNTNHSNPPHGFPALIAHGPPW